MSRVVWLHLDRYIPQRDVRKLVWRYLSAADRMAVAFAHGCYKPSLDATTSCADEGRVDLLQMECERGCTLAYKYARVYVQASRSGSVEVLDFIEQGRNLVEELDTIAMCASARGHINVIQWAQKRGYRFTLKYTISAARNNQIRVLEYMRDAWTDETTANAGSLETLKWLRQHKCPWSESTLIGAAQDNMKDMFMWALQNACPVSGVLPHVIDAGWVDAIESMYQMGHPMDMTSCMYYTLTRGNLEMAQWFLHHGANWPTLIYHERGINPVVLRWMRDHGYAH